MHQIWPWKPRRNVLDRAFLRAGFMPGFCIVCGKPTVFRLRSENFREDVMCAVCGSFNRQRQIVYVLLSCIKDGREAVLSSLSDVPSSTRIWNAEASRALHEKLSSHLKNNYFSSEYIAPALESGQVKDGIMHVDMQRTHFEPDSLDVVISSDVLEHIPYPGKAISEVFRILRPGGLHIFTVPFYGHRFTIEKRVQIGVDGKEQFLMPPIYHGDPVREGSGVLVYNIFAPELLCELEAAGFDARLMRVYSPAKGILGDNGIVIIARKPLENENHLRGL